MKAQNMVIDINRLSTRELKVLAEMYYDMNMMAECKQVNDRIAFIEGWFDEEAERAYYEKFCA